MADPHEFDDVLPENTARARDRRPEQIEENIWARLLHMILIGLMLWGARTILSVVAVIQFVILLVSNKKPNARLAEFGESVGIWYAKAVRYQSAASEVKPWPWTELD